MSMFKLDRKTEIVDTIKTQPVRNAIEILKRDIDKICGSCASEGRIVLQQREVPEESYELVVTSDEVRLLAGDDLGFVYGLLRISGEFLGVKPFWFWMDQEFKQRDSVEIPPCTLKSPTYAVRYRGWFFNDEVLLLGWKFNENSDGWRMCFETLLRCGGNMCIPGTDKTASGNRALAASYGLIITHHHAEPLGAEMFARAYPDLEADYFKHPREFQRLWEDAVIAQRDMRVVWNLCFRGQGDVPFWVTADGARYDTDEKRGRVISEIMQIQADIVKKYVDNPGFCTNLYGEILELYEQGYITFPENAIFVKADNGFGRMVTRRRGNHNPRVDAMPKNTETRGQGIYYHVSFYDLQAANHITMLPNSVEFVDKELSQVLTNKGDAFWVVNCSNVLPHTYFLDLVTKKWRGESINSEEQAREFARDYFPTRPGIADCYRDFAGIPPKFGEHEDEHGGEQLYTENVRHFNHYALLGRTDESVKEIQWLTGDMLYEDQLHYLAKICRDKLPAMEQFLERYRDFADTTIYLQARLHYLGAKGVLLFEKAYEAMKAGELERAFVLFGDSASCFEEGDESMRASERGVWEGFYANECLADYSFTAYEIKKMMSYVREIGDNTEYYKWHHKYLFSKEDQRVHLVLFTEKHSTDEVLYKAMKGTTGDR